MLQKIKCQNCFQTFTQFNFDFICILFIIFIYFMMLHAIPVNKHKYFKVIDMVITQGVF